MSEYVVQAFTDLAPERAEPRRAVFAPLDRRFVRVDAPDQECRADEADRVGGDRRRRADRLHEDAAHSRPGELRARPADLQPRVAVDDLVVLDEGGQDRLVRDVEEDREAARDEHDDEQLRVGERVERVRQRHRSECDRAPEVGEDEDGPAREPIDDRAGRQAEQHERRELHGRERADRERRRMEHGDRDEREREHADLAAELRDRLGNPEMREVPIPPERAFRLVRCAH